jgi:cysteine desulfurase
MIYADNAATTKLDPTVFEAMKPFLLEEYGNASQPYSLSRRPKEALAEARAIVAECIHAKPEEIFFTSGGTESDNWAIKGSAFSDPDHRATITSAFEHHAILRSCAAIERLGYPVAYLCPSAEGIITANNLAGCITHQTRLVSIMLANNELGSIQPIKSLSEIAHSHGALFHTDAVQAVGHIEIDVRNLGVDMLSASAHKFNGPKGVGFLYVRSGTKTAPYANGGTQEHGLRAGTENVASIVGMAVALKNNCEELDQNRKHLLALENALLTKLDQSGIYYQRNGGDRVLPGLLSLSFPGSSGERLLHRMDLLGICISTGSACDSKRTEISHVLKAIGLDDKAALGTIRISLGKYNDMKEVNEIADMLIRILSS